MLLKSLQSLALDVRVLQGGEEVEILETVDMGETDFRSLMNEDRNTAMRTRTWVTTATQHRSSREKSWWM